MHKTVKRLYTGPALQFLYFIDSKLLMVILASCQTQPYYNLWHLLPLCNYLPPLFFFILSVLITSQSFSALYLSCSLLLAQKVPPGIKHTFPGQMEFLMQRFLPTHKRLHDLTGFTRYFFKRQDEKLPLLRPTRRFNY
ncbi:hypothetical protein A8C56_19280 [Niabella ginsenosidivorans]|uniref:Uncharacterized protein n=1 Tax=Niabella ginsenosidivorans TaxID=1176587 RepID=A0A1A9I809_9BACT|nr:hypothetical protein A8C56_19280 [Niabella ginsenosidivorans]